MQTACSGERKIAQPSNSLEKPRRATFFLGKPQTFHRDCGKLFKPAFSIINAKITPHRRKYYTRNGM